MTNGNENKFQIKIDYSLEKVLEDIMNGAYIYDEECFPVEFDDCVDFMLSNQVIYGFGEIYGCCSYGLVYLIQAKPEIKEFISSCVKKFVEQDSVSTVYFTDLVEEGSIVLTTEEYCGEEMPRMIWATLPSEEKAINEWYEKQPEKFVC